MRLVHLSLAITLSTSAVAGVLLHEFYSRLFSRASFSVSCPSSVNSFIRVVDGGLRSFPVPDTSLFLCPLTLYPRTRDPSRAAPCGRQCRDRVWQPWSAASAIDTAGGIWTRTPRTRTSYELPEEALRNESTHERCAQQAHVTSKTDACDRTREGSVRNFHEWTDRGGQRVSRLLMIY
jgi:hypothetical protein